MRQTSIYALIVMGALGVLVGCNKSNPPTTPANKLLGKWAVVGMADFKITWTFDGNQIVIGGGLGHEISRSNYTIDTSFTPIHIDMVIEDIVKEDRPGIFEFDGDRLRLAFSVDGSSRPTNFSEGEGLILKRDD